MLYRLGLTGAFPAAHGHDLLGVTTQNAANNKIDVYLQRLISDAVTYDPANGAVASRVTVTLHNEAPAQGLPNEVIGSYHRQRTAARDQRDLAHPLQPARAAHRHRQRPASRSERRAELGVHAYSEYVDIPPEGSVTLTFDLVGATTPGPGYKLSLYNQPMVQDDLDTVTVEPTPGWTVPGPPPGTPGTTSPRPHVPVAGRTAKGPIRAQAAVSS